MASTLGEALASKDASPAAKHARPTADSVARMLVQAIRSQDRQLLEDVLSTGKEVIIRNTLKKLPIELVVPFLGEIVKRVQMKPSRTTDLLPWLRICLIVHGVYLASVPDIAERLSGLYELIEVRQATLPQLTRLHGRLDLMVSQLALQDTGEDREEDDEDVGPLATFHEDELDDDDVSVASSP